MKRIELIILLVFLVMQFFVVQQSFAQPTDSSLESFSDQAMNKLKNADFVSLSNDFYFPKEYTEKDIQNDKEGVITILKEFVQGNIGMPENFLRISSIAEQFRVIDFGTGTLETAKNLTSSPLFYKAQFSKFGNGYVTVEVHQEDGKFFIKTIAIALPVSNPKSAEIERNYVKFMRNMNVQMAETPASLLSGKKIKILGMGPMLFTSGKRALVLNYQTDISLDDMAALRKEVDSIWQSFRNDVEKADMNIGIIKACEAPKGTFIKTTRSYNFVFKKDKNGMWHCGDEK